MGVISKLKSIVWSGDRCSRCNRPLEIPKSGAIIPPDGKEMCGVLKCMHCGAHICEYCQGFGFGMMQGCTDCGGTNFEAFQMWTFRD